MAHELAWTIRQKDQLRRKVELLFAGSEHRQRAEGFLISRFIEDVTLYPEEWPDSEEETSDDFWKFGGIMIRYRRHPSEQLIEVLEVEVTERN